MLRRIKQIQGIGTFTDTSAGGAELTNVTVIYGENRYGKSTLCDILRSLAEDSPEYILDRKSIPSDPAKPPKASFQFSTAAGSSIPKFEAGQWQEKIPDCSKIYVFDQSFIHRNVITGQRPERPNSESMTSFILGESNTALFEALADMNTNLREERRLLSNIESQFVPHNIADIQGYIASPLPTKTKEQLEADVAANEVRKQQTTTTIKNIDQIKQRTVLSAVGTQVKFESVCESINTVLAADLQNVHQQSLEILTSHTADHVNDAAAFKGWAGQGLSQIKDGCPFCGQALNDNARKLIAAYQQAFSTQFDNYNQQTRQTLNNLRQPFSIPHDRESLAQQHQTNMQLFGLYIEPQITTNQALPALKAALDQRHEVILVSMDVVKNASQQVTSLWTPKLEKKFATPYEAAQQIDFQGLLQAAGAYDQAIFAYWQVAEKINLILTAYKNSLDETQLRAQLALATQQQAQDNASLLRIALEPTCIRYREKVSDINSMQAAYDARKQSLGQSQSAYLETYFETINGLFQQLGSTDFEILKVPNNRGRRVIYDLQVKFKGEGIPADKINTIFSESDRRALALCIFLAKVMTLTTDEKLKAILVLDDPVTSFDNERITLILNKLDELQRTIKQLIVVTHYKGMAVRTLKKFRGQTPKAFKLESIADNCEIVPVDVDTMTATDHDIAFDKIKAFVNRETNDDILRTLRPFFESEIRHRYKKQLLDLGNAKSDLSICIVALKDNDYITAELEARLSALRDSLNNPMHDIESEALENTRALADTILKVIYNEL